MSSAQVDKIARTLENTEYVQVVRKVQTENSLNIVCRIKAGNEKAWVEVIQRMLLVGEEHSLQPYKWNSHFCKHYFLKNKKVVYGWSLTMQSENLIDATEVLITSIKGQTAPSPQKRPVQEIEEMEMTGLTEDRNVPKFHGDKGAFFVESKDKKKNFRF